MASKCIRGKVALTSSFLFLIHSGALASDKLIERIERLESRIAASSEAVERSEPALEELRKKLFAEALRVRNAKQLTDEMEANADLLDISEKAMKALRADLKDSAEDLRELSELFESLNSILSKAQTELQRQEKDAEQIRKEIADASDAEAIAALEGKIAKAESVIAEQAATIKILESGIVGDSKKPSSPPADGRGAPVAPAKSSPSVGMTVDKAFEFLTAGKIEEAQQGFESLLAEDPTFVDAEIGLAACAFALGRSTEAKGILEPLLENNRENPRALGLQGALLCQAGDFKGARKALEKAVKLDGENAYYANYLGVALKELGRQKDAIRSVERAVQLDPYYLGARYNLAIMLATASKPDVEAARFHYGQFIAFGGGKNEYLESVFAAYDKEQAQIQEEESSSASEE